jgi:hypothetical protein
MAEFSGLKEWADPSVWEATKDNRARENHHILKRTGGEDGGIEGGILATPLVLLEEAEGPGDIATHEEIVFIEPRWCHGSISILSF